MFLRRSLTCWLILALLCLLFLASPLFLRTAEPGTDEPGLAKALALVSGERMLADVRRLSSEEFNGRQTGTADDFRSGLMVAERFQSLGLQLTQFMSARLGVQGWAMPEPVTVTQIADQALLQLYVGLDSLVAQLGTDYLPILDSPSVNVIAPVVFVGYGISDPARGFDEYEGLDVRNRIVLFLRGKPDWYPDPVATADKERTAREKGAVAFLLVTGPIVPAYEARRGFGTAPMGSYSGVGGERPLPGAWITPALAERLFAQPPRSLREAQEHLNRTRTPRSGSTGVHARLLWESRQAPGTLYNFLAVKPGADPRLAPETIVIGAHRDHFGRQGGVLFPGADDNASGTAVLLEVARVLAGVPLKRSVLFISFSGEEQGLLGSRFYINRPARSLSQTLAMINVDHAGVGNGKLTVGVTGLHKEAAMEAGRRADLADRIEVFGFFPGGDHVPFKEAGIPTVTVVSGGAHPHFHQPTDTAETVKPDILEAAARYVLALSWQLANAP
ncbi:MAG: M28 family peptidase [Nitrospira sp.]|nr:M28 family peptidase [Nitrospira sp.]